MITPGVSRIWHNSQVFVVAADSGISSLADLAGKVVEVQTDSSAEAALKEATRS